MTSLGLEEVDQFVLDLLSGVFFFFYWCWMYWVFEFLLSLLGEGLYLLFGALSLPFLIINAVKVSQKKERS